MAKKKENDKWIGWEQWWQTLPVQARNRFLADPTFVDRKYHADLLKVVKPKGGEDK